MHVRDSLWTLRRRASALVAAGAMMMVLAAPATAHEGHPPERLAFDRPEAWALKYFTSATLLAGLDTARARTPWSVSFGAELGWLPAVSEAQRFVGFNGTKPEDLNKAPVFVRPRLTIGLPGRLAVTLAFVPPVRSFGLTPRLIALAVDRPVVLSDPWTLGVRAYGQTGTVKGAYTCPTSVLQFEPGSAGNLYGCEAESSDTATLRYFGAEVSLARSGLRGGKLRPHLGVALNYLSVAFQVNALTFGFEDRTRYTASGLTVSGNAGVSYPLGARVDASLDAFYTPLGVRRASGHRTEGLFNLRALVSYRLR